MTEAAIQCLTFSQLSVSQLYAILKLRQQVFIEEQQCIYPDIDGFDLSAWHILYQEGDELMGYVRLRQLKAKQCFKVERVVTAMPARGTGLGKKLMSFTMEYIASLKLQQKILLSAQVEVIPFYRQFDFQEVGEAYDDAGIMHKDMWHNG